MPPISENGSLPVVNKERISSDLAMQIGDYITVTKHVPL